jgi:hypothetical protein
MTERELIAAAYSIQVQRNWSNCTLATVAGLPQSTWYRALNECQSLRKTNLRKLTAFVAEWSDASRPTPARSYDAALHAARAIQQRRDWPTAFCSELAGVSGGTWKASVVEGSSRFLTKRVLAKVQAFVEAWSDDSKRPPRRHTAPNGCRYGQTKVTSEVLLAITASNKPQAALGAEFGLSLSPVYRIKAQERAMKEAS